MHDNGQPTNVEFYAAPIRGKTLCPQDGTATAYCGLGTHRRRRRMERADGTSRVGVSIVEQKEAWLRLFVAWIADDNVVDGMEE